MESKRKSYKIETLTVNLLNNIVDAMNSLYESGLRRKLYKLLFELNCSNLIRVKTKCGTTHQVETGENVAQGSISGGLISAVNLDYSVTRSFKKSKVEISYHNLHISPLIFQDDCNRCTLTVSEAQEVNNRFEQCVQPKLLDFNTDKSCFVITGPRTK